MNHRDVAACFSDPLGKAAIGGRHEDEVDADVVGARVGFGRHGSGRALGLPEGDLVGQPVKEGRSGESPGG